ncbi:hypothetical protein ACHAQK_009278 [Fusarium lateritium]
MSLRPSPRSTDFLIVRFTLGLSNSQSQPLELCFHADFTASPLRPITLHFYGSRIAECRREPSVILDLGRVDVSPEDPRFAELVEGELQREMQGAVDEQIQREEEHQQDTHSSRCMRVPLLVLVAVASFLTLGAIFFLLSPQIPPEPATNTHPYPPFPLLPRVSAFALSATNLIPTIFFNEVFYKIVNVKPGDIVVPPAKQNAIQDAFQALVDLAEYVSQRLDDEAWGAWLMSKQDQDAYSRLLEAGFEYGGVRQGDVDAMLAKAEGLKMSAMNLFDQHDPVALLSWTVDLAKSIQNLIVTLTRIKLTPEDDILIARHNKSSWVPVSSLPRFVPPGVQDVLEEYTWWMTHKRDPLFSSTCKVLRDCSSLLPDVASSQIMHPSCTYFDNVNNTLTFLQSWAVGARGMNIPDQGTSSDKQHFWPNEKEFPALAEQVRLLAQLQDLMEQGIQVAEHLNRTEVTTATSLDTSCRSILSRAKDWALGRTYKAIDPEAKIAELKTLLHGDFHQVLHDVVQGMRLMHDICRDFNAVVDFVDALGRIDGWVIDRTAAHVQLLQMPPPAEQAEDLSGLRRVLEEKIAKTQTEAKIWYWWRFYYEDNKNA